MFILGVLKNISTKVNRLIPGEKRFGPYRFLPIFFIGGALLEYAMIHWRPNGINFYDTYKRKRAHAIALERFTVLKEVEELFLGSTIVHWYYQPLADLEDMVQSELEELKRLDGVDCTASEK